MEIISKKYNLVSVLRSLIYTMGFNTAIAFILTAVGYGGGFGVNLVFSQCIGLSICGSVVTAVHFGRVEHPTLQWLLLGGALLFGAAFGIIAGSLATENWLFLGSEKYRDLFVVLAISVMFGIAGSYFFISREQIAKSNARIQEERIQRLTIEKEMADTRLKLLQAQIEPHFLYNTLSNILSLVETDNGKARMMLSDLIQYLRATLTRTRETITTIGQEMEVVRAYINIFKLRMGDRLTSSIVLPDDLFSLPFPPMLIQPLVENAIRHGIEPLVDGGKIMVSAEKKDDKLRVRVTDTGIGISGEKNNYAGVGLANIRERLKALYGERARIVFEENRPSGMKATIEVPLEEL